MIRPVAGAGVVTVDPRERALIVRPAPGVRGLAEVLWADAIRAHTADAPTVWASACGQTKVAFGLPGDDGTTLRFRFPLRDPVYRKLVGTPGLRCVFTLDRTAGTPLTVRFLGR